MHFTVAQIAELIGAEASGDLSLPIKGIARPDRATPGDLALAFDNKFLGQLNVCHARVALLPKGSDWQDLGLDAGIYADRPRYALALATRLFDLSLEFQPIQSSKAAIADTARIEAGTRIGEFSVIGENVAIGSDCNIASQVTIGNNCRIGRNAILNSGTRIGHSVTIGENFIAHPNVVIGCDGFSFETSSANAVDEVKETLGAKSDLRQSEYTKVHSLGTVVIGDDVEIGAGCTIDRGTMHATSIGSGTKLDNLVHIAHNVTIGEGCLLCGQVGVAGSTVIGNRVVLAGMTGVKDHIRVGNDVVAAGSSKIFSSVPDGMRVMGNPATDMRKHISNYKAFRRLSRVLKRLESQVSSLADREATR